MNDLIGGRYRCVERIGAGGMATVWRAQDERLRRDVAIKLLKVDGDEDLFYFHREARASAALSHRNIVAIHDYSGKGESPPWLVMELVAGQTLRGLLHEKERIPIWVAAAVGAAISAALAHAHSQGVVHRDIKPDNVLIANDGRVLLSDFGIAKAYKDPERLGKTTIQEITQLWGTPTYMSPEQLVGNPVGPPSDVFSFGAMLYFAISGSSAFAHDSPNEVVRRVGAVEYEPLSGELSRVVAKCLQRDPKARPTAETLARELEAWLESHGISRVEQQLAAYLRGETVMSAKRKQRWTWLALAAVGVAGAAFFAVHQPPAPVVAPAAVLEARPEPAPAAASLPTPDVSPPVVVAEDKPKSIPAKKPVVKAVVAEEGSGSVDLVVVPWGRVTLDDALLGITPAVHTMQMNAGTHRIVIEHPAFGKRVRTVDVHAGQTQAIRIDMREGQP